MIGHKKIVKDLTSLCGAGRLGHGYIFMGESMVGKRTTALALAHFLEKGIFEAPEATQILQDTKLIDASFVRSLDPEKSGDSIGIDAVREIKNFLWQRPNISARRTLIIDDAELLTNEAQNALLKVTEEPPLSSLLILIVSDIENILPTIASRLPKIYFGGISKEEIGEWLIEYEGLTKTKADAIANQAMGKPGMAWRLLHDEVFKKNIALAEQFLKTSTVSRKDFIKKLIEPDDFNLRIFLEALITTLAWEKPTAARSAFWHKTLNLHQNVTNFGLNPRLQLEALMR